MPTYNADGTLNSGGTIKEFVQMKMVIQDHVEKIDFAITGLGSKVAFIGHDWLKRHNPTINWRKVVLLFDRCPKDCEYIHTMEDLEHWEQDQQETTEKIPLEEGDKLYKDKVPRHYQEYKDVFNR